MQHTIDDLTNGDRLDIVVEFISERTYQCGESTLSRLLVADRDGTRFDILGPSATIPVQDLRTGDTFRISGLLGATTPSLSPTDEDCPNCGGPLRPGDTVDLVGPAVAQTAIQLDLGDRYGVIDSRTVLRQHQSRVSLGDDRPSSRDSALVQPPEYVCRSCERHVWITELGTMAIPGSSEDIPVTGSEVTDR